MLILLLLLAGSVSEGHPPAGPWLWLLREMEGQASVSLSSMITVSQPL
jgi:hypothetical protein